MEFYDVLIVGSGVSGLFSAINLDKNFKILLISKDCLENSNSSLAQGGVSVKLNSLDHESFLNDTLKAGHFENNIDSVNFMINSSRDVINDLISLGVDFNKSSSGELKYTKEAAHSTNRIVYHDDLTGLEIVKKLLYKVSTSANIKTLDHTTLVDLIIDEETCYGALLKDSLGNFKKVYSKAVILATGGIGGLFKNSTNKRHITGDGLEICLCHNIKLKNIPYIQIHPTALYVKNPNESRFLVSESLRGEGAILLNKYKKRFVDELLPRDILTNEIFKEMKNTNSDFVYLKADFLGKNFLSKRFPNILSESSKKGYDLLNGLLKVSPAQHYFMGGISVDLDSKTSVKNLFACGETACTNVHGKNRLASNSLLEALTFSKRLSKYLNNSLMFTKIDIKNTALKTTFNYEPLKKLFCLKGEW